MAAGTKLIMRFGTTSGEKNFTYNYGNSSVSSSTVVSAMDAFISNNSIFKYPPLTKISAKFQVTTETTIPLS